MKRVALAGAVAALVVACGNKQNATPAAGSAESAAGSAALSAGSAAVAAGSATDPWSGSSSPAGAGSAAPAPCSDADIKQHIEAGLGESAAYLAALEKKTARWKKDCEAAKQDLLALEPAAKRFMDSMTQFATWGRTLSAACRKRVEELGEQHPITRELEKRSPALEERIEPVLERCKDHPGFRDAAAKGLRVMRKKSAGP